jgi:hypothetical protein
MPISFHRWHRATFARSTFTSDEESVLVDIHPDELKFHMDEGKTPPAFELAGARKKIYFDPSKLRCALVTCGGLCPGFERYYPLHCPGVVPPL